MTPSDEVIDVKNSDDIVAARQAGHQLARDLGFSLTDVTMIATAISEVARNITSYAGSGAIRVAVADRGTGISAERLSEIFEPFYTTKSGGSGMGMGLAIARNIVEAHAGRSESESMRLNARLILLLANHIGDPQVIREAIACAASTREEKTS